MSSTGLIRLNLHVGDYMRQTGHLSAIQHGAFFKLIMHYWSNGGLPEEDGQLAVVASMSAAEWRKNKPIICKLFEPGWKLPWLEADMKGAYRFRDNQSKAGKKGNEIRWGKARHAESDRYAFGARSQRDPSAIAMRSLPLAARHNEEPDQEKNYSSVESEQQAPAGVAQFVRTPRQQ